MEVDVDDGGPIHNKLAPEIMSYIFELCMPEDGKFYTQSDDRELAVPLGLARVCKAWKIISFSTPQLWCIILINANKENLKLKYRQVEEQLRRSGQTPLSIRLHASDRRGRCIDYPWYQKVIQLLNQHSTRWHLLDIRVPGPHWHLFNGNSHPSSILRVLHLDEAATSDHKKRFKILNARPRPEILSINLFAISLSQVEIGWDRVTDASISWIGADQFMDVLHQALQLKFCKVFELHHIDDFWRNGPYTHNCLQSLIFERPTEEEEFLDAFIFPNLQSLTWSRSMLPISGLLSLFKRSSCVLHDLILLKVEFIEDDFLSFLKNMPSLWHLEFSPSPEQSYEPESFFHLLSTTSMLTNDESKDVFLPQLKVLKYIHPLPINNIPWRHIPGAFGRIDSFHGRRPLHTLHIRIQEKIMPCSDKISYIPCSPLRHMRNILKAGFKLEVTLSQFAGPSRDLIELSQKHHSAQEHKRRRERMRQRRYLV